MARYLDIAPGDVFVINGREHLFSVCLPPESGSASDPDVYQFTDRYNLRPLLLDLAEFERLYCDGKIQRKPRHQKLGDAASPEENQHDTLKRRYRQHFLTEFDKGPVRLSDCKLNEFIDKARATAPFECEWRPSPGTVRRWIKGRGAPGDRRLRFMGDRRRRGSGQCKLHPVVSGIIEEKAKLFWREPQTTCLDVWASVYAELNDRNERDGTEFKPPSKSTIWRILKSQLTYENAKLRLGARKAQRTFKPVAGSLTTTRILEVALVDHTVVDAWVIDDEHGVPLGRPYLTIMLDSRSRYPLGYYLGFEPPSLYSTMACLRHALRPKCDLKDRFPSIQGEWIAYGVPTTILVDNGWEFCGSSFEDACEDLGISVEWAPVRTPEYKGQIERFFGTLKTLLFNKVKGGVPFKPQQMNELGLDPQANAVLMLSDLEELIVQCVVEVYGRNTHRSLAASPEQVWRQREKLDHIQIADDLTAVDAALGVVISPKVLSRSGITHDNLTYCSDEVFGLLQDLLPLRDRQRRNRDSVEVKIKVRPDDLGSVFVWNEVKRQYVELPCTQPDYANRLSRHHHSVLKEWTKAQSLAFETELDRCRAKVRLKEKIDSYIPFRVRDRRRRQRLKSDSTATIGDQVTVRIQGEEQTSHLLNIGTSSNRADGAWIEKSRVRAAKPSKRRASFGDSAREGFPCDKEPNASDLSVGNILSTLAAARAALEADESQ